MPQPPVLTPEQREQALAKAAEARRARAELKEKLKMGSLALPQLPENRTALLETGPPFPEAPLETDGDLVAVTLAAPSISNSGAYPPGFSVDCQPATTRIVR